MLTLLGKVLKSPSREFHRKKGCAFSLTQIKEVSLRIKRALLESQQGTCLNLGKAQGNCKRQGGSCLAQFSLIP